MGDYTRERRLGAGQFGEVRLAFHQGLGVRHAVKYVREENVPNPTQFFNELQLLKELEHPNIVKVEDAGRTQDGHLFIAMEYVPTGSVADRFRGKPVPLRRIKPLIGEALRGLEYAHARGYLHRDIKPANILIARGSIGKLSDFGLATRLRPGRIASPYGYVAHLAPEVITRGETSPLSDIYAVGITLYRLVNGDSYLSEFANEDEFLEAIKNGEFPDRKTYRIYIPRSLKTIINKAMNPDSSKRFQTAEELRHALEQVQLACSWREKVEKDRYEWRTETDQAILRVEMLYAGNKKWNVQTLRRWKKTDTVRHIRKLSLLKASKKQAQEAVSRITTSYVNGKQIKSL